MPQFLEACMLVAFGISWPINIYKSLRSHTAKGKSLWFMIFVLVGYLCGLAAKLTAGPLTYVAAFYVLNLCTVSVDLALTVRNKRRDKAAQTMI